MTNTDATRQLLDDAMPKAPIGSRIAILGGSFDPPHFSHQMLALATLSLEKVDQLWVLPCKDHPLDKKLSPFGQRLRMCEIAFSHFGERVHVVGVEQHLSAPSYTVHTLEKITQLRPGVELLFVMGSDLLSQIDRWHEPERIKKLCELVVFARPGYQIPTALAPRIRLHRDVIMPDVQSSQLREGELFKSRLVDHGVLEFARQNAMYKKIKKSPPVFGEGQ